MDPNPLIGGKYRLEKLIGAGGMGQVWVARNEVTEREFAIKLLLPQAAANPQVVARFIQEAKVSGRLRHPGILEIYDVGTAPELQNAPFLVMELLHGVLLEDAIRSLRGLPVRFTLLVAIAVARALQVAHARGVIHRDLKPANVFLHRNEAGGVVPKLLDFGISKLARGDDEALGLTQTGALLGSPRFMSPEQVGSQKDIDGRSDVHALGVLVWWCLVARSPFVGPGLHNLLLEILSDDRPRLTDALLDVPPGVSDFVSKAFARRREDRHANAGEALAALEAELAKLGPGPTLESPTWHEELLSRVQPAPPPATPPLSLLPPLVKETTTHGAVSVSVERADDGASPVDLVEKDFGKKATIQRNLSWVEEPVKLHLADVRAFLKRAGRQWDVVYADPPFPMGGKLEILELVAGGHLLVPGGSLLMHYPGEESFPGSVGPLVKYDHREYGRSHVVFYTLPLSEPTAPV